MARFNFNRNFNALHKTHEAHEQACATALEKIKPHLSSEFDDAELSVFFQPSDGFVLEYDNDNASLVAIVDAIDREGFLTLEEYHKHTI